MGRNRRVVIKANSISLIMTSHTYVLGFRVVRLKSLPSDLVHKYIPSVTVSKEYLSKVAKKIQYSGGV